MPGDRRESRHRAGCDATTALATVCGLRVLYPWVIYYLPTSNILLTYLLTYILAPACRVFPEHLTSTVSVRFPPAGHASRRLLRRHRAFGVPSPCKPPCCAPRSSCLLRPSTRSRRLARLVASRRARRARARCSRRRTCSLSGATQSARRARCASSTCAPPSWERSRSRHARAMVLERRTQ